ncbi:hypothetical protein GO755_33385 [Spirosoma sp. HMF4905]|uniref:Uncharacterized protein n=1 Tax=Spirosoma arboris TaxID=2682092 RepID=A0A7K1SMD8_9BACT|nr:hypothetical protein [Spirosoma arboris]MVM34969.1 hypothetical protein [Spirosoma arboris]
MDRRKFGLSVLATSVFTAIGPLRNGVKLIEPIKTTPLTPKPEDWSWVVVDQNRRILFGELLTGERISCLTPEQFKQIKL